MKNTWDAMRQQKGIIISFRIKGVVRGIIKGRGMPQHPKKARQDRSNPINTPAKEGDLTSEHGRLINKPVMLPIQQNES